MSIAPSQCELFTFRWVLQACASQIVVQLAHAVPMTNFEIAFKMFDLDGNGTLEPEEFVTIFNVLLKQSRFGVCRRDSRFFPRTSHFTDAVHQQAFRGVQCALLV